uniref:Shieldin complex subunit 2 C-terminal domain-containing protein n=1 Tax=Xiphophorus couchianus TaxID=32473 RepID=A0A3B5LAH2_9TELE
MHQRPKIHIFLGAPPPPPPPPPPRPPSPGMEEEEEERPAGWRHLELTWKAGRLRPAAGEGGLIPLRDSGVLPVFWLCDPTRSGSVLEQNGPFLSNWTLSQALILRGRHAVQSALSPDEAPPIPPSGSSSTPELFSPAASSPGDSMELFSHTCPASRAEQGGVVMEVTADGVLCSQESDPQASPASPPCSKKPRPSEESTSAATESSTSTTRLDRCDQVGRRYSVLVVVVHPCHLKEVQVRSGLSAGSRIPLASMVVTDQSGAEMKVVLWRRAAFWVLTVSPGEVLLITGTHTLCEDRWRAETVLQSTFSSKLLNLGHASTSKPGTAAANQQPVSSQSADLSRLPYTTLRSLRVNTLVHALLRVTDEAESRNRSAVQMKAVLMVQQPGGQQGALLLWGAAMDWEGLTSDLSELHSTPWSSVRVLDPTDRRALDFLRAWCRPGPSDAALDGLKSKPLRFAAGEVELRVQVLSFQFQEALPSQNPAQPVLDSSTPRAGLLAALSGDITYTGCSRCTTELDTDRNGIYTPCYACLPLTALPPGSQMRHVQVAAEKLQALLALPRKWVVITVRSHFLCDQNSVPLSQDFTLMDLQVPTRPWNPLFFNPLSSSSSL